MGQDDRDGEQSRDGLETSRRTLLRTVAAGAAAAGLGVGGAGTAAADSDAMGLVPADDATHVATGGVWADSSAWEGGVPGADAAVLVPEGVTLELASETARLHTVRVEGELVPGDAGRVENVANGYLGGAEDMSPPETGTISYAGSLLGSITEITTLEEGNRVFIYDDARYESVPERFRGLPCVRPETADGGLERSGSLAVGVTEATTLYVAFWPENEPDWLSEWEETGDIIQTGDGDRRVYRKDVEAGLVRLGGCPQSPRHMYTVFAEGEALPSEEYTGTDSQNDGSTVDRETDETTSDGSSGGTNDTTTDSGTDGTSDDTTSDGSSDGTDGTSDETTSDGSSDGTDGTDGGTDTPESGDEDAVRVDAGGDGGNGWTASGAVPYDTGGSNASADLDIDTGAVDAPASVYRSERYGAMTWAFPVQDPGPYEVRLYFAEIDDDKAAGDRVFDVVVEGETALSEFDILAHTDPDTGIVRTVEATGDDGTLELSFEGIEGNPKVSAIEIVRP